MKKLTTKKYIQKAKKVHRNKFDYSLTEYIGSGNKIKIICFIHGIFEQVAGEHMSGKGCRKCQYEKLSVLHRSSKKAFIKKAQKLYNKKYKYTKVKYKNNKTHVEITCPKHGSFWQRPDNHLNGHGCIKCGNAELSNTEEFIEKAIKVFGNFYDYSLVKYRGNKEKVKIICPEHGIFEQRPNDHTGGHGCRKCGMVPCYISKPETQWLNELNISNNTRQYFITIKKKHYVVDGYDEKTNTIYEFLGDYWHGNPKVFDLKLLNQQANKTFGQLYKETMNRIKLFEKHGYRVNYIWESDFK